MPKLGETKLGVSNTGIDGFGSGISEEPELTDRIELTGARARAEDVMKTSVYRTGKGTFFDAVLEVFASQFDQEVANFDDIEKSLYVDDAEGAQLDKIGDMVLLDRQSGEPDDEYRRRIKIQIPKAVRGGTIEDVIETSAFLLECNRSEIQIIEAFDIEPARFDVYVDEIVFNRGTATVEEYQSLLQGIRAGGVHVEATLDYQFTYRSVEDYQQGINDSERGYGGIADDGTKLPDVGGRYADQITRRF